MKCEYCKENIVRKEYMRKKHVINVLNNNREDNK